MSQKNTVYLSNYEIYPYLLQHVALCFDIYENETIVDATLSFEKNMCSKEGTQQLILNGEDLELLNIRLDGQELSTDSYTYHDDRLVILSAPDKFTLETRCRICPQKNTQLSGLYASSTMLCTQCEAEGFRRITFFPDRPDVMTLFTTKIIADKLSYPILLSNGNLIAKGELRDNRHWATWEDPFKKPSYLFALVAGDLSCVEDSFTTSSGRDVLLQMYVEKTNVNYCQHALDSLKKAMAWDEEVYSREYDLQRYMIVAVSDFNMGAMENKGLNIFNTQCVLADPETATDHDYYWIEAVIGHEYFHNWSGNRVTCRDWFQLSLKEGLTVFREQEFSAAMGSPGVKRIEDVERLRNLQFTEDAGPLSHPVQPQSYIEIDNFYTMTVYEKGAELIRMMKSILGDKAFYKAINYYFSTYDGQAVTIEDFVHAMETSSKKNLQGFMAWYYQAGTPVVSVVTNYDAKKQQFTIHLSQKIDNPSHMPLVIPIKIALISSGESRHEMLLLTEDEDTFQFNSVKEPPVLSLLREFSAPIKVEYQYSDDELCQLIKSEYDSFSRWEAMQLVFKKHFISVINDSSLSKDIACSNLIKELFHNFLIEPSRDQLMQAKLLMLPAEQTIGQWLMIDNVNGVHHNRKQLKLDLGNSLFSKFLHYYDVNNAQQAYNYTGEQCGQRSLKNTCLSYLAATGNEEVKALITQQFCSATNMTDCIAALEAINLIECDEREYLFDQFYTRWKNNPLVLDKWFSLQANCQLPGSFERVKKLADHQQFNLQNPNRVRALLGSYSRNRVLFHQDSGEGYEFMINFIIKIDSINPQIAARLAECFTQWQRFPSRNQALMKAQLGNLLKISNLSNNVYEIASKSYDMA